MQELGGRAGLDDLLRRRGDHLARVVLERFRRGSSPQPGTEAHRVAEGLVRALALEWRHGMRSVPQQGNDALLARHATPLVFATRKRCAGGADAVFGWRCFATAANAAATSYPLVPRPRYTIEEGRAPYVRRVRQPHHAAHWLVPVRASSQHFAH